MGNKWNIAGWGHAQMLIREAVHFLCDGKIGADRAEVVDEVIDLVKDIGWPAPPLQTEEIGHKEEYQRESWGRRIADQIVGAALGMTEDRPPVDRDTVLREIARKCLWHISNARAEARRLTRWVDIDRLKQPDWRDPPPGRD